MATPAGCRAGRVAVWCEQCMARGKEVRWLRVQLLGCAGWMAAAADPCTEHRRLQQGKGCLPRQAAGTAGLHGSTIPQPQRLSMFA